MTTLFTIEFKPRFDREFVQLDSARDADIASAKARALLMLEGVVRVGIHERLRGRGEVLIRYEYVGAVVRSTEEEVV